MPRKTINQKVEPEDIELLARVAKKTGKPVDQLILEAVRATYGSSVDGERGASVDVVEALQAISVLMKQVREVVEIQGQLIRSLSGNATGNATGKRMDSALHGKGVDTESKHRESHERHTREQGTT